MRRKINTTISIELKRKERLEQAILNREDLIKKLDSWDKVINYLTNIIEQRKDLN